MNRSTGESPDRTIDVSVPELADAERRCLRPFDTTAGADDVQRSIYRRLGGRERIAVTFRLNDTVRRIAMSGIRSRHPDYSESEVQQAYVRLRLGDTVVRQVWPNRTLVDP